MTKKSVAELRAEKEDLEKRLKLLKEIEDAKKGHRALEKEVRDLHRATSTKWKVLGAIGKGLKEKGLPAAREVGKFFAEETRNFINEEERENSNCNSLKKLCCEKGCKCKDCGECGKMVKEKPDTGEGLL